MKKNTLYFSLLLIIFISCNKNKTSNPSPVSNTQNNLQQDYYSFKIGNTSYSLANVYGQNFDLPTGDTLLMINGYGPSSDTISGGFTLKVNSTGTFTHDSTNVNENNRFVLNFGNYSNPNSTYVSKTGTINITTYDKINRTYAGTFSAVMTLSTNPSYTLPLTDGAFYMKSN